MIFRRWPFPAVAIRRLQDDPAVAAARKNFGQPVLHVIHHKHQANLRADLGAIRAKTLSHAAGIAIEQRGANRL